MTSTSTVTGDSSELAFALGAKNRGIHLNKPLGGDCPYDYVTDAGDGRLLRVQVKSTEVKEKGKSNYRVNATYLSDGKSRKYTQHEADVVAVHVVPKNIFYFIPLSEVKGQTIRVYPDKSLNKGSFESYRDNWNVLRGNKND